MKKANILLAVSSILFVVVTWAFDVPLDHSIIMVLCAWSLWQEIKFSRIAKSMKRRFNHDIYE